MRACALGLRASPAARLSKVKASLPHSRPRTRGPGPRVRRHAPVRPSHQAFGARHDPPDLRARHRAQSRPSCRPPLPLQPPPAPPPGARAAVLCYLPCWPRQFAHHHDLAERIGSIGGEDLAPRAGPSSHHHDDRCPSTRQSAAGPLPTRSHPPLPPRPCSLPLRALPAPTCSAPRVPGESHARTPF
jgi:hypothetical protein